MNMFKASKATDVASYLEQVPAERQDTIQFLHQFIQKIDPALKPFFAYNMLGYGVFKTKNYKKEMIDWPVVSLASQKNYMSLYVCSIDAGQYIAEKYKDDLGKVGVGKSCIRFKKLEDLNLDTLSVVLKKAAKAPGLQN